MKYQYTCFYCDYKWSTDWKLGNPVCGQCGDRNCKLQIIEKGKTHNVFGYEEDKDDDSDKDPIEWFNKTNRWGTD